MNYLVGCDFCSGARFHPQAWNQRTCHRCAAVNTPDQSKPGYEAKLRAWRETRPSKPKKAPVAVQERRSRGRRAQILTSPRNPL